MTSPARAPYADQQPTREYLDSLKTRVVIEVPCIVCGDPVMRRVADLKRNEPCCSQDCRSLKKSHYDPKGGRPATPVRFGKKKCSGPCGSMKKILEFAARGPNRRGQHNAWCHECVNGSRRLREEMRRNRSP